MEFNSRIIYSAPQSQFFKDVMLNKVVGKMVESSAKINFSPGKPELNSWNNNVRHVKDLIELSEVNDIMLTFSLFTLRVLRIFLFLNVRNYTVFSQFILLSQKFLLTL